MPKRRDLGIPRLCQAIARSRLMLRQPREVRKEAVRQYVGLYWSEEGARTPVPVNMIALYVQIVARNLISKNPRVLLTTDQRQYRPMIETMQAWCNDQIEHMRLDNILQRVAVDGLFSIGIAKVALATPSDAASRAWSLRAGTPFVAGVDLDDFVYDAGARSFDEVSFIGHRYRVPIDTVKDSKLYSKERKDLEPNYSNPYNKEGDERVQMLGKTYTAGLWEEYQDMVDLWEIYLPRDRVVVTLAEDHVSGPNATSPNEALRVQRWIGPDSGPYHILGFGVVPGNPMPKAPVQDLLDLHEVANQTMRKIIRTVERVKELTICGGGNTEDLDRILNASDGDAVSMKMPDSVRQIVLNGEALQRLIATYQTVYDQFNRMAGNLELLGGISPQSKTASQDQMLNQNSTRTIAAMQEEMVTFVSSVCQALCWYHKHDPITTHTAPYSPGGMSGITALRMVTPQQRQEVPWDQLRVRVDPYSLRHKTPEERMAGLDQTIQQTYLPMAQVAMQQGINLDLQKYFDYKAKYLDQPEIGECLTVRQPPEQPAAGGGGGDAGPGPAQTTRNYTRTSMPGATREASDRNTAAALLGANLGGNQETKSGGMQ